MRKAYRMSEEQLKTLMDASKPVRYMIVAGREPSSPQENANRAWSAIGDEMGFDHMTVKPDDGGDNRDFTAEPITGVEPDV